MNAYSFLFTPDFFRSRIDAMINLNDPLVVLAIRLPWAQLEAAIAAKFARRVRVGALVEEVDLFGPTQTRVDAGTSPA